MTDPISRDVNMKHFKSDLAIAYCKALESHDGNKKKAIQSLQTWCGMMSWRHEQALKEYIKSIKGEI